MQKMWLSMCLLAVLGLQGIIMVECTAVIFFPYGVIENCTLP